MKETYQGIPPMGPRAERDSGFAVGPIERYTALALVATFLVVCWCVVAGWGPLVIGFGLALGLLCVFARTRLATPLFLAWVLVVLLAEAEAPPSQYTRASSQQATGLPFWILEVAVMTFLIAVARLHALTVGIFPAPPDRRYFWTRLWHYWKDSTPKPRGLVRDRASCSASEQWTVPLWALVWLLVAGLFVAMLPVAESYAGYFGVDRRTMRAVLAGWLVVLLPTLSAGALAYARWRRLSKREASVYLRSVLWHWNRKEQTAIARYFTRRSQAR